MLSKYSRNRRSAISVTAASPTTPSLHSSPRPTRRFLAVLGALAMVGLTACTPSVPQGSSVTQSAQSAQSDQPAQSDQSGQTATQAQGSGSVADNDGEVEGAAFSRALTWVVPQGSIDVQQIADALTKVSGTMQTVQVAEPDQLQGLIQKAERKNDLVVLGLDAAQVAQSQDSADPALYATDYTCVVANQSWFAVNKLAIPTDLAQVLEQQNLSTLQIPDPQQSAASAWWLAAQLPQNEALTKAKANQANANQANANQTSAAAPSSQLAIDSALLPWRTVDNTGTFSQWVAIPSTCVPRPLYAIGNPEAVQWLQQAPAGLMVKLGLGYTLAQDGETPQMVGAVAPRPDVPDLAADSPLSADPAAATARAVQDWANAK